MAGEWILVGHPEATWSRATAPLCQKEPDEVVRESDASWAPSFKGSLGLSNWVETQNLLEGLYISSGLGMLWNPQEDLESVEVEMRGEGSLEYPAYTAVTQPLISGR